MNKLFGALCFLFIFDFAHQAEAALIRSGEAINDFSSFYLDKDQLSVNEVYSRRSELFSKEMRSPNTLGFTTDTLWLLFTLDSSEYTDFIVLETTNPTLEEMEVVQFDSRGQQIDKCIVGSSHPHSTRGVYYRNPNCKLYVGGNKTSLLIRFPSLGKPLISELIFWDLKDFESHSVKDGIWLNMCLGGLFMIGVVNILIYFSTRERTYLLYGFFELNMFVSYVAILGIASFFDPTRESANWVINRGIFVSTSSGVATAILFSRQFLNMGTYMPRSDRLMLILAVVSYINAFTIIFHISQIQIALDIALAGFGSVLLLVSGFRACSRGYKPAYLYTAAWIIFFITTIHLSVGYAGWVEWSKSIVTNFLLGGALEGITLSFALGYRIKLMQKTRENETLKKEHYFNQMTKVFYPHQIQLIQEGKNLEETMPTSPGEACVISFDIIGSSKIQHVRAKEFFRNVFKRCYEDMMGGYDEKNLASNAFRIKEMGDGFLCSVGYPFRAKSENPANDAVKLAFDFQRILFEESWILEQSEPIHCGIGISLDTISGFYPEFGTKEYDVFGRAIILATRYESMRKVLFEKDAANRSIIILQEKVYASISPSLRKEFAMLDLVKEGITVRDDPSATKLYFKAVSSALDDQKNDDSILKIVAV